MAETPCPIGGAGIALARSSALECSSTPQAAQRFLVTQDLDFSDVRVFAPGTHYGFLLVRLQQPGRAALRACVRQIFETEDVEQWTR